MDRSTRSYLIYFGLLIVCFLLANRAERKNNKFYVFLIAFALSFISGFRGKSVGVDTSNYYWIFNSLTSFSSANKYNDPYFYKLAFLLMKINNDPHFPIMIFAFVSNFLVIYRLWDFRNYSSYKYAVTRYITLFLFFSMNCIRQFLAIAIVFWATKYLEEGNYKKYILYVGIASLIHIAALTSLSFLIVELLKWNNLSEGNKNVVKLSMLLTPVYVLVALYASGGRLESYINTSSFVTDVLSVILKFVLFIAVVMFTLNDHNIFDLKEFSETENQRKMSLVYYLIGLVLSSLGYIFAHFERIGYFFYIYATVYLGIAANEKRYRIIFRFIILFIIIRSFYLNCANGPRGSMGQMPFLFKWE